MPGLLGHRVEEAELPAPQPGGAGEPMFALGLLKAVNLLGNLGDESEPHAQV